MENKKKKIALLLSIFALLFITTGVTITFFQYAAEGLNSNTIRSGSIVFHYQEIDGMGHGISITDAVPVSSNNTAKDMDKAFNFEVTSTTTEKVVVPYTVTARLNKNSDLVMGDIVDVYLTEVNGNSETPTALFSTNLPKYSELEQYSKVTEYTEKVIYEGEVPANTPNYKKNFRLRIWIDEDANYSKQCSINPSVNDTETKCNTANGTWGYLYNNKEFSITVNVNAEAKGESTAPRRLYLAITEPAIEELNNTPDIDITDANLAANHCTYYYPGNDSTCKPCDPSTDPKCSSVENKKKDKCTNYTNGICVDTDDDDNADGTKDTIYYYRGDDVDNYVKFGDDQALWRILRTNSDETVRIMRTQPIDNNQHQYSNVSNNTGSEVVYFSTSSAKKDLENWYAKNIGEKNLDEYVASGKYFCEQFKYAPSDTFVQNTHWRSGDNASYYGNRNFYYNYNCLAKRLVDSEIGLMTIEDYEKNTRNMFNFLTEDTWTMSPSGYLSSANITFHWKILKQYNSSSNVDVTYSNTLYPVINLKSDVMVTGTGSQDDPFVVVTSNETTPAPAGTTLAQMILDDNPNRKSNPDLTRSPSYDQETLERETGFYELTTSNGYGGFGTKTYYFRGNVTNNVVKFANKLWRVLRINEDGTVRLVLDTSIDTSGYNLSDIYDYRYVQNTDYKYMYYSNYDTVKPVLKNWYNSNITGTDNDRVAKGYYYCEAFKVTEGNSTSGVDATPESINTYTPDYSCQIDGNGYGLVFGKVGLLSYDDAAFVGFTLSNFDSNNFLYKGIEGNNNYYYWTMSPEHVYQKQPKVWYISGSSFYNSGINAINSTQERRLRPVINLKADTTATKKTDTTNNYNYYEVN